MKILILYGIIAFAEIIGCFAFWAWRHNGASGLWIIPGTIALAGFAFLLTFIPSEHAGRAYAAYGGINIAASLIWLWAVEGKMPDRWDITGAAIAVTGAAIILLAPRAA